MRITIAYILAAFFLLLAIYFYWQKNEAESRLTLADTKLAKTTTQVVKQEAEKDSLEQLVLPPDTMEQVRPGGAAFVDELGSLSQSDIQKLERRGLKHPEADLMNDLNRKQSMLLPEKGTMGGTMTIRDSRILNDRYALAYYEDGHNGGYMVLKYEVNNGNITWKVVDSSRL